jgi:hypothetical protein
LFRELERQSHEGSLQHRATRGGRKQSLVLTRKCERNIEDAEEQKDDNKTARGRGSRERRKLKRMRKRVEAETIFSL